MDNGAKLRAAIIGYGVSGELSHAYGLRANPEFEIVAACDLAPERRSGARAELGCETFPDHRSLLDAQLDLDLACVVTRTDTHCAIATDFLNAGINTLVTKPWVMDTQEAEILIAAQKSSGAQLFPWVPALWSDEIRRTRELIASGAIGKVFMLRRQLRDFRRREDWQTERRYGGGYLLNWGAHIVHPLVELVGSPVVRVRGHLQKIINPGDADDGFLSILEFENGVLGIAEFAQACGGIPTLVVQGDRGTIHSDGQTLTLQRKEPTDAAAPSEISYPLSEKIFGDEAVIYRDIADCLLHGATYPVGLEEALQNTRILDAIRNSHESGESLTLSLSDSRKLA